MTNKEIEIKTPEEIGHDIIHEWQKIHSCKPNMQSLSYLKCCIAEAIRAERATRPEPSKSIEEWWEIRNKNIYKEFEIPSSHKISCHTTWNRATECERARVIAALPKSKESMSPRDLGFNNCLWLVKEMLDGERIEVGAGEGK